MPLSEKFQIIIPPQDIAENPGCLENLANGDAGSFRWIYKSYSRKIFDYALIITGNVQLSEDIVQEVFLKVWMHREKLKGIENFNGYINSIVRNYTIDQLRGRAKEQRDKKEFARSCSELMMNNYELEYRETQQIFRSAIRQLPPKQQSIYLLKHEYGCKRHQMAKQLKISPFTVKAHIQRAIKSVRSYVEKAMR